MKIGAGKSQSTASVASLVAVVLKLIAKGITALPLHDSVIVAQRHAKVAQTVMQQEARRLFEAPIPATIQQGEDS